jgi:hypothetical protein
MRFFPTGRNLLSLALAGSVMGTATFAAPTPAPAAPHVRAPLAIPLDLSPARRHAPKPPLHVIRSIAGRNMPAAAATYSILDVGGPPTAGYYYDPPHAFNDSDVIVGQAYNANLGTFDCFAYTGTKTKRFIDMSAGSAITQCNPTSVGAATGTSTPFVGYGDETTLGYFALSGNVSTNGSSSIEGLSNVVTSYFIGVNASGEAIGEGVYIPQGGFFSTYPPYVQSPGATSLALAQPQCSVYQALCADNEYADYLCPFGGCEINDAGLIMGYDDYTGVEMVYSYGGSGKDLPFNNDTTALNNANQILYSGYSCSGSCAYATNLYSLKTGSTTPIPTPKNSSCTGVYGLSLNNLGEVLGETTGCAAESDYVYVTWTAKGGTKVLNSEIPANAYESLEPIGVNDSGEILLALFTPTAEHWGLLVPKK